VLEDFRPHALLCDICMPEEDGYSFIRRVRALQSEHVRKLPAAALTALASRKDQTRALSAGFQMHLTKPISPEALCGAILKLSGRRNGI
jgi:CheY-like chemotaxis protein